MNNCVSSFPSYSRNNNNNNEEKRRRKKKIMYTKKTNLRSTLSILSGLITTGNNSEKKYKNTKQRIQPISYTNDDNDHM
jgi:hypothetical protein